MKKNFSTNSKILPIFSVEKALLDRVGVWRVVLRTERNMELISKTNTDQKHIVYSLNALGLRKILCIASFYPIFSRI